MKANFTVRLLDSLWNTINVYAKEHNTTVGTIVEEYGNKLILSPKPLMIRPNRKITKYHKTNEFYNRYPMSRRTLYLNVNVMNHLLNVYEKVVKEQFDSDMKPNLGAIIHTVMYYFCMSNELQIDYSFFDDSLFTKEFMYSYQDIIEAIHETTLIIGRLPTSREYQQISVQAKLPSINLLKEHFGSYRKALKEYESFMKEKGK